MVRHISNMVSAALLAGGAFTLGACSAASSSYGGFDGVPLAELDTGTANISALGLSGIDTVVITEGPALDIAVENDHDDAVRFRLDGSSLEIGREPGNWSSGDAAIIRVTMPAPSALDMSGTGRIETAAMAPDASISMSGSGTMQVASFGAETLDVEMSGAGKLSGWGTAKVLDLSLSGSSDVDFGSLVADTASIAVSGAGTVILEARERVAANVSGSGDVRITGTAQCVVSTSGSGKVSCPSANASATTTGAATN
ncbi:MAG: head GIN domain-containing protein [Parerythrobacter sp.]